MAHKLSRLKDLPPTLCDFTHRRFQTAELILRCYGVVFGVLIVLVELELPFVLSHAAFMDSWVARGLCIAFVGLLDVLFDHQGAAGPNLDFWRHLVGYLVMCVGSVYTALGLLCFRKLKAVALTRIRREKIMKEEVRGPRELGWCTIGCT